MKKFELIYPLSRQFKFISQYFGENKVPLYKKLEMLGHNGIDWICPDKASVYATHDGIITYAGVDSSGGWGVVVKTNEPFWYQGKEVFFKTIYWHLTQNIPIKVGQKVETGDLIGYADNSGMSTATHLHFGLKPIAQGENEWTWYNLEQSNGYFGAIPPDPYWSGFYPEDIKILIKIKSIAEQIINILKNFLKVGIK